MQSERNMNASAVKSQEMITKALLDLMRDKPYSEITISEIADRANRVRRTFYAHFNSKEEVLECYIDEIIEDYMEAFCGGPRIKCRDNF